MMLLIAGMIVLILAAAGAWTVFSNDAGREKHPADHVKKISGIVTRGKQKGRALDFPTANIALSDKEAASGVYAGKAGIDGKKYDAAVFVGKSEDLLEAHILGFNGDLYGKKIEVEVGRKIREVLEFENDEDLKEQIKIDIISIKNVQYVYRNNKKSVNS